MKLAKRLLIAALSLCVTLGIVVFAAACNNGRIDPTTYAVTYDFGSCDDTPYAGTSPLPTESEKEAGATFNLADALVWEGYDFLGWNDGTNTYDAGAEYSMPASAVTLTAVWEERSAAEPEYYAVTYSFGSSNGVAYAGTSTLPTESDKAEGETFTLAAAPVWSGYTFLGWYDESTTYEAGAEYTMPAKAVSFIATWRRNAVTYTVTYSFGAYDGTPFAGWGVLPTESDKVAGATFTLADEFAWDGYTFLGWSDGLRIYDAGAQYTMPARSVTLTAVWEKIFVPLPDTYKITYSLGSYHGVAYTGTDPLPTEPAKEEGETFYLAAAPVWNGYTFLGWNDGTTTYEAGAEYTMPAKAVTFTATWRRNATYTVTYSLGAYEDTPYAGMSALPTETDKSEGETFYLAGTPVWNGYAFLGWSDGETTYPARAEFMMPAEPVTFTATWSLVVTYTVTYSLGSCDDTPYDGTSRRPTESAKRAGVTFRLADEPVWENYRFLGWSDGEHIYAANFEFTMPAQAVTLTAVWEKNPTRELEEFFGHWQGVIEVGESTKHVEFIIDETILFFPDEYAVGWERNISYQLINNRLYFTADGTSYFIKIIDDVQLCDTDTEEVLTVLTPLQLELPSKFIGHWIGVRYDLTITASGIKTYIDSAMEFDFPAALSYDEAAGRITCKIQNGTVSAVLEINEDGDLTISIADNVEDTLVRHLGIPEDFFGAWYGDGYEITISADGIESYMSESAPDDFPTDIVVENGRIYCTLNGDTPVYFELTNADTIEIYYVEENEGDEDEEAEPPVPMATLVRSFGIPEGFVGTWYGNGYEITFSNHGIEDYADADYANLFPTNVAVESGRVYCNLGDTRVYFVVNNVNDTIELRNADNDARIASLMRSLNIPEEFFGIWYGKTYELLINEHGIAAFTDYNAPDNHVLNIYFEDGKIYLTLSVGELSCYLEVVDGHTLALYLTDGELITMLTTEVTTLDEEFLGHWIGENFEILLSDTVDLFDGVTVKAWARNLSYNFVGGKITFSNGHNYYTLELDGTSIMVYEGASVVDILSAYSISIPETFHGRWVSEDYAIIISEGGFDSYATPSSSDELPGLVRYADGILSFVFNGVATTLMPDGDALILSFADENITLTVGEFIREEDFYGHWIGENYEVIFSVDGLDFFDGVTAKAWARGISFAPTAEQIRLTDAQGNVFYLELVRGAVRLYLDSTFIETLTAFAIEIPGEFLGQWTGDDYAFFISEEGFDYFTAPSGSDELPGLVKYANGVLSFISEGVATTLELNSNTLLLSKGTGETAVLYKETTVTEEDFYGHWVNAEYEIIFSEDGLNFFDGHGALAWMMDAAYSLTGDMIRIADTEGNSFTLVLENGTIKLYDEDANLLGTLSPYALNIPTGYYGYWTGGTYDITISEEGIVAYTNSADLDEFPALLTFASNRLSFTLGGGKSGTLQLLSGTLNLSVTGESGNSTAVLIMKGSLVEHFYGHWVGEKYEIIFSEGGLSFFVGIGTEVGWTRIAEYNFANRSVTFTFDHVDYTLKVEGNTIALFETGDLVDTLLVYSLDMPDELLGRWVGEGYDITISEMGFEVYIDPAESGEFPALVQLTEDFKLSFVLAYGKTALLEFRNGTLLLTVTLLEESSQIVLTAPEPATLEDYYGHWVGEYFEIFVSEDNLNTYYDSRYTASNPNYSFNDGNLYFRHKGVEYYLALDGEEIYVYTVEDNSLVDTLSPFAVDIPENFYGLWIGSRYEITISEDGFVAYSDNLIASDFPVRVSVEDATLYFYVNNGTRLMYLVVDGESLMYYSVDEDGDQLMDTLTLPGNVRIEDFYGHWVGENSELIGSEAGIDFFDGLNTNSWLRNIDYTIANGRLTYTYEDSIVFTFERDGNSILISEATSGRDRLYTAPALVIPDELIGDWTDGAYYISISADGIVSYTNPDNPNDFPALVKVVDGTITFMLAGGYTGMLALEITIDDLTQEESVMLVLTISDFTVSDEIYLSKVTEESFYGHWVGEKYEIIFSEDGLDFFDSITAQAWVRNVAYTFTGSILSFRIGSLTYTLERDGDTVKFFETNAQVDTLLAYSLQIPEEFFGRWMGDGYDITISELGLESYIAPSGSDEIPALVKVTNNTISFTLTSGYTATLMLSSDNLLHLTLSHSGVSEHIYLSTDTVADFYGHWVGEYYEIIVTEESLDFFDSTTTAVWVRGIEFDFESGSVTFEVDNMTYTLMREGDAVNLFRRTNPVDTLQSNPLVVPALFFGRWVGEGYDIILSAAGFDLYTAPGNTNEFPALVRLTEELNLSFMLASGKTAVLAFNDDDQLVLTLSNTSDGIYLNKVTRESFYGHWVGEKYEIIFSEESLDFFESVSAKIWVRNVEYTFGVGTISFIVDDVTYTLEFNGNTVKLSASNDSADTLAAFAQDIPAELIGRWLANGYEIIISADGFVTYTDLNRPDDFPAFVNVEGTTITFTLSGDSTGTLTLDGGHLVLTLSGASGSVSLTKIMQEEFYGHWIGGEYELIISEESLDFFDGVTAAVWTRGVEYTFVNGSVSFTVNGFTYTLELAGNGIRLYEDSNLMATLQTYSLVIPNEFIGDWIGGGYYLTISETGFVSYTDPSQSDEVPALLQLTGLRLSFVLGSGKTAVLTFNNGTLLLTVTVSNESTEFTLAKPGSIIEHFHGHWIGEEYELVFSDDGLDFFDSVDAKGWARNVEFSFENNSVSFTVGEINYTLLRDGNTLKFLKDTEPVDTLRTYSLRLTYRILGHWAGEGYDITISTDGIVSYTAPEKPDEFPAFVKVVDGEVHVTLSFTLSNGYTGTLTLNEDETLTLTIHNSDGSEEVYHLSRVRAD